MPRSQWEPIVAALKSGQSKESVLLQLAPYSVTTEGGMSGGGSTSKLYRLDDAWILKCSFGRSSGLFKTELIEHIRHVWVAPSSDFTGVWINSKGAQVGTWAWYNEDGSIRSTQEYPDHGAVRREQHGRD